MWVRGRSDDVRGGPRRGMRGVVGLSRWVWGWVGVVGITYEERFGSRMDRSCEDGAWGWERV